MLIIRAYVDVAHIDLPAAAIDKIAENGKKYPIALSRGRSDKHTKYSAQPRRSVSEDQPVVILHGSTRQFAL